MSRKTYEFFCAKEGECDRKERDCENCEFLAVRINIYLDEEVSEDESD